MYAYVVLSFCIEINTYTFKTATINILTYFTEGVLHEYIF